MVDISRSIGIKCIRITRDSLKKKSTLYMKFLCDWAWFSKDISFYFTCNINFSCYTQLTLRIVNYCISSRMFCHDLVYILIDHFPHNGVKTLRLNTLQFILSLSVLTFSSNDSTGETNRTLITRKL